jgi:polyhydroxybutyrate depolymerase
LRARHRQSASRGRLLALGLLLALGIACTSPLTAQDLAPGESRHRKLEQRYNGLPRSYRLHVPAAYDPRRPTPLVVVLHGAFSNAAEMEWRTGWSELADRENFVVIYPNGIGLFGLTQHWNAGHCCGAARSQRVDDMGAVASAIEEVRRVLHIDPDRIHMTGFSNGAMLTHLYAATRGEQLASIAPLAGAVASAGDESEPLGKIPRPTTALPAILFHGRADAKVPYAGGRAPGSSRVHSSARDAAEFWRERAACKAPAVRSVLRGGSVTLDAWRACEGGIEVLLYSLDGWGHRWPGPRMMDALADDAPLRGFDATETIWQFFLRHPRRAGAGARAAAVASQ